MDTPQLLAMCSCVHFSHRNSGRAIRLKKPKSTTLRRSGPFIWPGRGVGANRLQNVQRLRADKQALAGYAAGIADGRAEHVVMHDVVRIGLLRIFGDGDGVVQRDHRCRVGIVGQEDGGEELVLRAGPVERTANGVAAADLLGRQPLHLAIGHVLDFFARHRREPWFRRPRPPATWDTPARLAVLGDRGLERDDVGVAED